MTTTIKKNSLRGIFCVALFCIFFANHSSFTQNWGVGGNTNQQLGQPPNPIIGTTGNNPLRFITNNTLRMQIFPNGGLGIHSNISASEIITTPTALLHIGVNAPTNTSGGKGGQRDWMKVGTFYCEDTDNMYVGLKSEGSDRKDAVIVWSDNGVGTRGPDNLRFIFTGNTGTNPFPGPAGTDNGLEVARMTVNGNMGVGSFFTNTLPPQRRLDIMDDGTNASGVATPRPQFRLTYTQNSNVTNGIYTDFQTMSNGDLFINPFNSSLASTNQPRNVGIHTNGPQRRLEVFDDRIPTGGFNGTDQLRLSGASGGFADFQVTQQGHLLINPSSQSIGVNLSGNSIANLPTERLDINGFIRERSLTGTNVTTARPSTDGIVFSNSLGALYTKKNFTGSITEFLRADGTWATPTGGSGGGTIGLCQAGVALAGNSEINLSSFNFLFRGTGNVGIGLGTSCTPFAKLHVKDDVTTIAGLFETSQDGGWAGLFVSGTVPYGAIDQDPANASHAGHFHNSDINGVAGWFESPGGSDADVRRSIIVPNNSGYVGIYTKSPAYTLDVNGTIRGNNVGVSDIRFKSNVSNLNASLDRIKQLRGINFKWQTPEDSSFVFIDSSLQIGFIAQEVESIVPEVVSTDKNGIKSLNYSRMVALLTEGMKEQQATIDSQYTKIELLESRVTLLESAASNSGNSNARIINSETNNNEQIFKGKKQKAQLFACRPNPFGKSTTIGYFLPENSVNSYIGIYDMQGKQIRKIQLLAKGNNSVEIQGNDLYEGMFIYSLIVDGALINSKQMIMAD